MRDSLWGFQNKDLSILGERRRTHRGYGVILGAEALLARYDIYIYLYP